MKFQLIFKIMLKIFKSKIFVKFWNSNGVIVRFFNGRQDPNIRSRRYLEQFQLGCRGACMPVQVNKTNYFLEKLNLLLNLLKISF